MYAVSHYHTSNSHPSILQIYRTKAEAKQQIRIWRDEMRKWGWGTVQMEMDGCRVEFHSDAGTYNVAAYVEKVPDGLTGDTLF